MPSCSEDTRLSRAKIPARPANTFPNVSANFVALGSIPDATMPPQITDKVPNKVVFQDVLLSFLMDIKRVTYESRCGGCIPHR